ncbi:MAG: glycoside hydrolase family 13 protein [Bifidobacteriaceae bacterium]|nr:glycoside hydrolase family 13 protein [Bifidobacteriaceae bacterium]
MDAHKDSPQMDALNTAQSTSPTTISAMAAPETAHAPATTSPITLSVQKTSPFPPSSSSGSQASASPINLSAIRHDMDHRFCFALSRSTSCGASSNDPEDGFARFAIRIQTGAGNVASVIVHTEDKYLHYYCADRMKLPEEQRPAAPEGFPFYGRWSTAGSYEMRRFASDGVHDYFEVQLNINVICLRYYFEIHGVDGSTVYYSDYQFTKEPPTEPERMFDCPQTLREDMLFDTPQWAKNRVIYQVFPTAFAVASDSANADATTTSTTSSFSSASASPEDASATETPASLHDEAQAARHRLAKTASHNPQWHQVPATGTMNLHGNLRGIIEALPHIADLGAGMLYLNPIFVSPTPHKYDTLDYLHIDPSLGTEDDLKELVEHAHARDIKVILDGVFNHTSRDFFAFRDVLEHGRDSKYWSWYWLDDWPLTPIDSPEQAANATSFPNYKTFAYFGYMPKLNMANPEVQDYFINVVCHWIREAGVDGWRMDVGDEIDHVFWKRLRRAVRNTNPEAIIGAEVWHPAFDFLEGDEWDTVMNYHFLKAVKRFVATGDMTASGFLDQVGFMKGNLHPNAWPVMWNLLDSHDTPRFKRLCGDDDAKHRLAVGIQLLSTGMPMVYYGDEYGMTGDNDPDCRRGMVWDEAHQDAETFDWYQRLIRLRKQVPAICNGAIIGSFADDSKGLVAITKSAVATDDDLALATPREHAYQMSGDITRLSNLADRVAQGPRVTLVYHNSDKVDDLQGFDGTIDLITGRPFDGTLKPYQVLALAKGDVTGTL